MFSDQLGPYGWYEQPCKVGMSHEADVDSQRSPYTGCIFVNCKHCRCFGRTHSTLNEVLWGEPYELGPIE